MTRVKVSVLALGLLFLHPTQSWSQVIVKFTSVDPHFKMGGLYVGSAVYTPDAFGVFQTNGLRRFSWVGTTLTDTIDALGLPYCSRDPNQNSLAQCGDQIGLLWKHQSCTLGGPCGSNDHWNGYPGMDNATTYPLLCSLFRLDTF
jgi:hypothetical protein